MAMTAKQLRQKAVKVIQTNGWRQGDYGSQGEPVCLLGALGAARGCVHFYNAPGDPLVQKAVSQMGFAGADAAIDWNDNLSPSRGKRTVIERLMKGLV